jgi:hypothetical protein
MKTLPQFSMGIGDRFAHQGKAQLAAFVKAKALGVEVAPVWNKSNREHNIVHSVPASVREEADSAAKALGWAGPYFVDADHIGIKTVDPFIAPSDFFTLDVADFINKPATEADIKAFTSTHVRYAGSLKVPGIDGALDVSGSRIEAIARKYLYAAQEAGRIYQHIEAVKGRGNFITEVSMDETDQPQTPVELFFILAALADQKVPVQTIAPKFTGRFNKGVDYVGNLAQFEKEFNDDLCVIALAIKEFGLPASLKLSVHSGSDKFSIYSIIHRAVRKHGAGLHIKTAGTTWLARRWPDSTSCAPRTPPSSTSTKPSCRRPMRCWDGPASSSPPPFGTTSATPITTPASASSCTSASKSPRRWGSGTRTPSNNSSRRSRRTSRRICSIGI